MKVGIIRCQLTEDMCPGSTDFKVAKEGTLAFKETGPVEIYRVSLLRRLFRQEGGYTGQYDG